MKKIFIFLILTILISLIIWGMFFLYKLNYFQNKITIIPGHSTILDTFNSLTTRNTETPASSDNNRLNILLLGIAGKGKPGQYLTDTVMIASVKTDTGQVALLSLPRDLLVTTPEGIQMKINSVYQSGISRSGNETSGADTIKKIIENITSLHIDHYVVLNFDGFQKIIDAIGPINIMNERDIYDPHYPGPNYSYEVFELKKGFHQLDGATALKYARERHNDPKGDFGRAKRQQQIMESTRNKVFSAGTYLNLVAINDLFNALGDNIQTDVSPEDFTYYLDLVKKIDTNNVTNEVLDAWDTTSLLKVSHVNWNGKQAFVLVPRVGNWSEVSEMAENLFDLDTLRRRRDEIEKENPSIFVIDESGADLSGKITKLLKVNFNHKNVAILKNNDKSVEEDSTVYDFTNGKKPFSLDELVKKLPSRLGQELPRHLVEASQNVSPDFIVVLGKDLSPRYNMEEDSIEDYKNATDTNEYTEFIEKK